MTSAVKLSKRTLGVGLAIIGLVILLGFVLAPSSSHVTSGSTFSTAPDGYGAWYAYMEQRQTPIQQWQRPLEDLLDKSENPSQPPTPEPSPPPSPNAVKSIATKTGSQQAQVSPDGLPNQSPATLIRIYPRLKPHWQALAEESALTDWLEQGNTLILLGIQAGVTPAPFQAELSSPQGAVTLHTRRRYSKTAEGYQHSPSPLLSDAEGVAVWSEAIPKGGQVIFAVTPHLAANAYQDAEGNFAFLAQLAEATGGTIWVDEYLHGYKESDVVVTETGGSWATYLTRTPVLVAGIQGSILVGIIILAQNRRLGRLLSPKPPQVDNSEAYIQALAGVLHKANSHHFVHEMVLKAERLELQKILGLGEGSVEDEALKLAWIQRTQRASTDLDALLNPPTRLDEHALRNWLRQMQRIREGVKERVAGDRKQEAEAKGAEGRRKQEVGGKR